MKGIRSSRGYTLVELIVAVGLFTVVMTLVAGAYFMMISFTRQAQGTANGIDNLSFALETMTRTIRTGINYNCGSGSGGDCPYTNGGGTSLTLTNNHGDTVTYTLSSGVIEQTVTSHVTLNSTTAPLTDSTTVTVSSLRFYVSGTGASDQKQPYVIITVSGTVSAGSNVTESFTVETSAAMRGIDS